MNTKFLTVLAVVVVAAAFIPVMADDSDATATSHGEFNIYIHDGNNWTGPFTGNGYNAAIALDDYLGENNIANSIDMNYTVSKVNDWGSYTDINTENYGKVTKIGDRETDADNSWYAYYYIGNAWEQGYNALGFYKPFSDYNADFQTANIALYYGESAINASTIPTDNLKAVYSDIVGNQDFAVTFNIKLDAISYGGSIQGITESELRAGVSITGYGSDGATALINAISNAGGICNISTGMEYTYNGVTNISNQYGYVNGIYGVSGVNIDSNDDGVYDVFYYWSMNIGTSYAAFLLGYYTPLEEGADLGTGFVADNFSFTYIG